VDYQSFELPNGIRLVHAFDSSYVGHCGIFINAGSRDENESETGIAHFIEHTLFKGTRKRKTYHILSRLDDVGGELNAYTTKEHTVVYASFLKEYFSRALELISDIVFNSTFPAKEIEKEKEVVIDEINSYKDSPSEQIYDDFEELLYKDQAIGKQILGSYDSVKAFSTESIQHFIENNYYTDQMVISVVGNISFTKAQKLVTQFYGNIPQKLSSEGRRQKPVHTQFSHTVEYDTHQAHCIIGSGAFSVYDKRKTTLSLLSNLLGGQGLNARLNLSLREKHGIAYNIESNHVLYSDTGLFYVYFGTDKENLARSTRLINKEFQLIRDKKLGTLQLSKAKKQLIGQIGISAESNENQMLSIGKSMLLFGKVDPLALVYERINDITAESILEIANEILEKDKLSTLIFQ